jgi:carboxypeptidase C (cathepsin A)
VASDFVRFHSFTTVDSDSKTLEFQIGFLSNLVKIFPSLATRPLYLAGEDYAGVYIVRPCANYPGTL